MKFSFLVACTLFSAICFSQIPTIDSSRVWIQFFNRSEANKLFNAFEQSDSQKAVIVHMGDSHIQPDTYVETYRTILQGKFGNAGRGLFFPFSVAKTYSSIAYSSTYQGSWTSSRSIQPFPKMPLGIQGACIRTVDTSASISIKFKKSLSETERILKVFTTSEEGSFDLKIEMKNWDTTVFLTKNLGYTCIRLMLPNAPESLTFSVVKTRSNQNHFSCNGFSIESEVDTGILIHTAGIGGAQYVAPLRQKHFEEDLLSVNPNLVILDYGTNDVLYYDKIDPSLEAQIRAEIRLIHKTLPNCAVLLTTCQDLYRNGKTIQATSSFSELIYRIAMEENCLLFDWFAISGGNKSILSWTALGYARADHIHLSQKGYELKGQLLANAILETYSYWKYNPTLESWNWKPEALVDSLYVIDPIEKREPVKNAQPIYYTVKAGDTLYSIARKFDISADQLKRMNKLKSNSIRKGQRLKISS